jgi:hypothetical protein
LLALCEADEDALAGLVEAEGRGGEGAEVGAVGVDGVGEGGDVEDGGGKVGEEG